MKHYKKAPVCFALSLLSLGLFSCNGGATSSSSESSISSSVEVVTSISIEGKSLIGIREYVTFIAKGNGVEQKVKWSTSNKKIATVSSSGMVKGIAVGSVTITATLEADSSISATFDLEVEESRQLELMFNRFINASYYTVEGSGTLNLSNAKGSFSFSEEHFEDSCSFSSTSAACLPSYGFGEGKDGTYLYEIENSAISKATYLRDKYEDYREVIFDISDYSAISTSFSNTPLAEDGKYTFINDTSLMGLFFYIWTQNFNTNDTTYASVAGDLESEMSSLTLEVKSPYIMEATLSFSSGASDAKLVFTVPSETKKNTLLEAFLKNNKVSYPETYSDITSLKELIKNHNYYRDFGTYTKEDGTKIPIGKVYFTEDAMFYDYGDEYIEEVKETTKLQDHGYINIIGKKGYKDGVYAFTCGKNDEGEQTLILGSRYTEETDSQGNFYTHYYDCVENLNITFDYTKGYDYTFSPADLGTSYAKYNSYVSLSSQAQELCYIYFYDLVAGLGATPQGLIIMIDLDEEKPEESAVDFAAYASYQGEYFFYPSGHEYSGFNTVSVPLVDNFLASLESN